MSSPVVHAEIRSHDPDGTREFFGKLFGWTYPSEGAFPGYTFVDTGVPDALYTAISPLQGDTDLVTFFVGVEDMASAIAVPMFSTPMKNVTRSLSPWSGLIAVYRASGTPVSTKV